jgi:polyphosphate kinase
MSANVREILYRGMKLDKNDIYETSGWLGLSSLMEIYALPLPDHKDKPWVPVQPKRLKSLSIDSEWQHHNFAVRNIFSIISEGDLIVHHPYESFADSVQNLIEKAAIDPSVEVIKITLYRTSGDSPIIQSLVKAAQAGKQVIALVELKARFDEASNIHWANLLEDAGVHVVYGIGGLKTHTKILLIVREEDGKLKRYTHVGTGNYNPKTAKLYTDIGLLSCNEKLGEDLNYLFNFLTGFAKQTPYHKLLVAPVTLRKGILDLIHRETEHSLMDRDAKIIVKMNSLVDPEIIEALYKASQAGVQIELIIRGICCLMPGIKGISENISVISIVGQYLEHSRIFYFLNHGNEDILIGSADWMPRNLDRRVEAVCYVEDSICKEELKKILEIQLADNCKAWELESTGDYHQRRPSDSEESRSSQSILMQYYKAKSDEI